MLEPFEYAPVAGRPTLRWVSALYREHRAIERRLRILGEVAN